MKSQRIGGHQGIRECISRTGYVFTDIEWQKFESLLKKLNFLDAEAAFERLNINWREKTKKEILNILENPKAKKDPNTNK